MKKSILLVMVSATLLVMTPSLFAQGGCVDSPENPTAVLGLVGSAGGFFVWTRARLKARRQR